MKKIYLIAVLMLFCFEVFSQKDTSKPEGYIPLFDNLSSFGEDMPADFNGKLRTVNTDNDSIFSLNEAVDILKTLYHSGRFRDAFGIAIYIKLKQNDKEKFSKNDKIDFHKYGTAALKEMGYDKNADSLMRIFCNQWPFYKVKDNDPVAFVKLKEKFTTRPLFAVKASISKVYPRVILDTIYTLRTPKSEYKYSEFRGSNSEIQLVFYPTTHLSLSGGIEFSKFGYTRTETAEKVNFTYKEKDKFFSLPFEISYSAPSIYGIVKPEVFVGAKYTNFYDSHYTIKDGKRSEIAEVTALDMVECEGKAENQENSFLSLYGGLRLNYEYRRFSLFAGLSYGFATKELRDPKKKGNNTELAVHHLFVPDAMRLNQVGLNFGVKVNIFYRTKTKYGYGY